MTASAIETCSGCAGIGFTAANPLRECPTCYGLGRVPVPLRSCLTDAADDETERLRWRARHAELALISIQGLSGLPTSDPALKAIGRIAAEALEQLSK